MWDVATEAGGSSCENLSMTSMKNNLKPIVQNVLRSLYTVFFKIMILKFILNMSLVKCLT